MAHERETRKLKPKQIVPRHCSWQHLLDKDGDELETTYRHILEALARQSGTLGVIFRKALNRIQDPVRWSAPAVFSSRPTNTWRTRPRTSPG